MKAVWSFWTKPFRRHHHRVWLSERHHLLSWVLSFETARRHYPDTVLYTDSEGARLLVDRLGLDFREVSTRLDDLADADPGWWVLGKLAAYRAQCEPFVHIDSDVMLWKPLPRRLEQAPVFAQNPEIFPLDDDDPGSWYRPLVYDRAIRAARGWAPPEWRWYVDEGGNVAACCGILGGCDLDFIAHYAGEAMRMIGHPANRRAWAALGSPISDNILLEQYFLSACVAYHGRLGPERRQEQGQGQGRRRRRRRGQKQALGSGLKSEPRRFPGLRIDHLFASTDEAFDEDRARAAGYTHLIGGAKSNPALLERLEARVARDHPEQYERCLEAAAGLERRPVTS